MLAVLASLTSLTGMDFFNVSLNYANIIDAMRNLMGGACRVILVKSFEQPPCSLLLTADTTFPADLIHPTGRSTIHMNVKGVDALYADKGVDKVCLYEK